jgi:putative PIN family toxin of toxin-antitoxin system
MIRAVFDTNDLISYLLTHRPPIATLIDEHLRQQDFALVTVPQLLVELHRVLGYSRLRRYFSEDEKKRFLALVTALSEIVNVPDTVPHICRDPDDDYVIACAVAGKANVIVSGDDVLLSLKHVGGILIFTAGQFLAFLREQRG